MDQGSVTWIVTADGRQARIFSERARTGPLQELPALRMSATDEERSAGRRHPGTSGRRGAIRSVASCAASRTG